jgi:hypothetical protein
MSEPCSLIDFLEKTPHNRIKKNLILIIIIFKL